MAFALVVVQNRLIILHDLYLNHFKTMFSRSHVFVLCNAMQHLVNSSMTQNNGIRQKINNNTKQISNTGLDKIMFFFIAC